MALEPKYYGDKPGITTEMVEEGKGLKRKTKNRLEPKYAEDDADDMRTEMVEEGKGLLRRHKEHR